MQNIEKSLHSRCVVFYRQSSITVEIQTNCNLHEFGGHVHRPSTMADRMKTKHMSTNVIFRSRDSVEFSRYGRLHFFLSFSSLFPSPVACSNFRALSPLTHSSLSLSLSIAQDANVPKIVHDN